MNRSRTRTRPTPRCPALRGMLYRAAEPLIALWNAAQRLHQRMNAAYDRVDTLLRDCPHDDESVGNAHWPGGCTGAGIADVCERICKTEARTLEGGAAKLRCAARVLFATGASGE